MRGRRGDDHDASSTLGEMCLHRQKAQRDSGCRRTRVVRPAAMSSIGSSLISLPLDGLDHHPIRSRPSPASTLIQTSNMDAIFSRLEALEQRAQAQDSTIERLSSEVGADTSTIARLSAENVRLSSENAVLQRNVQSQARTQAEISLVAVPGGHWAWEEGEAGDEAGVGRGQWVWSLVSPPQHAALAQTMKLCTNSDMCALYRLSRRATGLLPLHLRLMARPRRSTPSPSRSLAPSSISSTMPRFSTCAECATDVSI